MKKSKCVVVSLDDLKEFPEYYKWSKILSLILTAGILGIIISCICLLLTWGNGIFLWSLAILATISLIAVTIDNRIDKKASKLSTENLLAWYAKNKEIPSARTKIPGVNMAIIPYDLIVDHGIPVAYIRSIEYTASCAEDPDYISYRKVSLSHKQIVSIFSYGTSQLIYEMMFSLAERKDRIISREYIDILEKRGGAYFQNFLGMMILVDDCPAKYHCKTYACERTALERLVDISFSLPQSDQNIYKESVAARLAAIWVYSKPENVLHKEYDAWLNLRGKIFDIYTIRKEYSDAFVSVWESISMSELRMLLKDKENIEALLEREDLIVMIKNRDIAEQVVLIEEIEKKYNPEKSSNKVLKKFAALILLKNALKELV